MANELSYSDAITKLRDRRSRLAAEIEALDKAVAVLEEMSNVPDSIPRPTESQVDIVASAPPVTRESLPIGQTAGGVFSQISIRWACLWILSQAPEIGASSPSITEQLIAGGRTSKAGRFASSVSAVLSNMRIKGEVKVEGNYWVLTQQGKAALQAILPRLKVLQEHS